MNILLKDLPKESLPRERLIKYGASNLTDEELLTILIRTGTKNKSCKMLASEILSKYKNIHDLKNMTIHKLNSINGLGKVKSITLLAALELGKRVYEEEEIKESMTIQNSVEAYIYFSKYIKDSKQENLLVIYLDNHKKYITHKIIFKGTINMSVVHPREIFKYALLEDASALIIMHNHPSGSLVPSKSDDETTSSVASTGSIMGIPMLDHLIVSKEGYYSYLEEGRIRYE